MTMAGLWYNFTPAGIIHKQLEQPHSFETVFAT